MCFSRILAATAVVLLALGHASASAQTKIRFILDWKFQGQMGMFFLAADRGYFEEEGLEVSFDQGEGAGAAATKIAGGAYDMGFGSLESVITMRATLPAEAPVAVFQAYARTPLVIAVPKDSPIESPKDLEGRTIGGPVFDGALKLFPAFAKQNGIDASKVEITNMAPNLRAPMLMQGQIDAAFAFYTAIAMDVKLMGSDPSEDLRFIYYEDHGMDLYSNTIVASQEFLKEHPEAVKGFVRALNKGLKDAHEDREAAVAAVLKREPLLNPEIERERLDLMFSFDMAAPEVKEIGVGDVTDERLQRNIDLIVDAKGLPASPAPGDVFDRSFLPEPAERLKDL